MKASLLRKAQESARVAEALLAAEAEAFEACVRAVAGRLSGGGRLFAFGNGGSACDAQHVSVEFQHPILEKRRAFAAVSLTTDTAMLTAVGNDRDFSMVFADQLRLLGRPEDVALALSTSGQAADVLRGVDEARQKGMLTVAFTGRDGGRLREKAEYAFVVPSYSIHRIQEAHTLLLHLFWDHVHLALGEDDVL